jgi:hypothetical protein
MEENYREIIAARSQQLHEFHPLLSTPPCGRGHQCHSRIRRTPRVTPRARPWTCPREVACESQEMSAREREGAMPELPRCPTPIALKEAFCSWGDHTRAGWKQDEGSWRMKMIIQVLLTCSPQPHAKIWCVSPCNRLFGIPPALHQTSFTKTARPRPQGRPPSTQEISVFDLPPHAEDAQPAIVQAGHALFYGWLGPDGGNRRERVTNAKKQQRGNLRRSNNCSGKSNLGSQAGPHGDARLPDCLPERLLLRVPSSGPSHRNPPRTLPRTT